MFRLLNRSTPPTDLLASKLYDQDTFYPAFLKDLANCHSEIIIECPFITNRRLKVLLPILEKLKAHRVRIAINTRDPRTHDEGFWQDDAIGAISKLQHMGVQILYEGSLNILSQSNSSEVMRRIESVPLAWQMVRFVGIDKFMN